MPERIQTGFGTEAPTLNNLIRLGEGYGWLGGGGVTRGSSSTDLTVTVDGGRVRVDSQVKDFPAATVTLPKGDQYNPRKDLIYVDYNGNISHLQGEPMGYEPEGKTGVFTWSPAPPDGSAIDGVVLAEIEVPAGAAVSNDLEADSITDRRVADVGGFGYLPVRSQDPIQEDLTQSRMWINETQDALRFYQEPTDTIEEITTSTITSFGQPVYVTIEDFEDSISANWNGSAAGDLSFGTPAIEGSNSAEWDIDPVPSAYSLPSDGLSRYPESGDTVGMGIYAQSQGNDSSDYIALGIAKEDADERGGYYVVNQRQPSKLRVVRSDTDGGEEVLGEVDFNDSEDTWYLLEIDYDGEGEGVHPARVYSVDTSTDPPTPDTVLAEITSPTADTTFRGRGIGVTVEDPGRTDYLYVKG